MLSSHDLLWDVFYFTAIISSEIARVWCSPIILHLVVSWIIHLASSFPDTKTAMLKKFADLFEWYMSTLRTPKIVLHFIDPRTVAPNAFNEPNRQSPPIPSPNTLPLPIKYCSPSGGYSS